jgi:hypothetical protein
MPTADGQSPALGEADDDDEFDIQLDDSVTYGPSAGEQQAADQGFLEVGSNRTSVLPTVFFDRFAQQSLRAVHSTAALEGPVWRLTVEGGLHAQLEAHFQEWASCTIGGSLSRVGFMHNGCNCFLCSESGVCLHGVRQVQPYGPVGLAGSSVKGTLPPFIVFVDKSAACT